ncbi:hypothetical protein [Crossiella sp. CA198]|uniref:hypothetical protein n=1 Tax=Crossiella sp. CA198 TaxID=3455607 RepID=UPI003F8D091D
MPAEAGEDADPGTRYVLDASVYYIADDGKPQIDLDDYMARVTVAPGINRLIWMSIDGTTRRLPDLILKAEEAIQLANVLVLAAKTVRLHQYQEGAE